MKELRLNMKECVVRIKTDMLLNNKRLEICNSTVSSASANLLLEISLTVVT